MQILVEDCDNERPDLILPPDTCVVAGTILDETILGIDPDNDNVKIEAFSEIFNPSANHRQLIHLFLRRMIFGLDRRDKIQWKTDLYSC